MTKLPDWTGARVLRALKKAGFVEAHRKGSHVTVIHRDDSTRIAVIALHGSRTIPHGTLRAILRGARLEPDQLRDLG